MRKFTAPGLVLLLMGLIFSSAWVFPVHAAARDNTLDEVKSYLEMYYVDPVDPSALQGGTPKALVEKLGDPYTQYFSRDEYSTFQSSLEGSFSGVGMTVDKPVGSDYVVVLSPLPGTPAEKAGVKPGDRILTVDGRNAKGMDSDLVASLIRGTAGTSVVLTLGREGLAGPVVLNIVRAVIQLPIVESRIMEKNLGYVKIASFSADSDQKFKKAVDELQKQGAKGLILDLRHNPGGYLEAGLNIADQLVPGTGPLVQIVSRGGEKEVIGAKEGNLGLPLVVLVDGSSASASEIVAAAVKDSGAGTVVGAKTFGKGTVQSVLPLSDGGALKVTTARYLSPKGSEINGKGVSPAYEVQLVEGRDTFLEKAIELLRQKVPEAKSLLFLTPGKASAIVDGREVAFDAATYLKMGRVMVPVRLVAEALGAEVGWEEATQTVRVRSGKVETVLRVGSAEAVINGQPAALEAPAELNGERTFVPLRFVSEALGAQVNWDEAKDEVRIER